MVLNFEFDDSPAGPISLTYQCIFSPKILIFVVFRYTFSFSREALCGLPIKKLKPLFTFVSMLEKLSDCSEKLVTGFITGTKWSPEYQ